MEFFHVMFETQIENALELGTQCTWWELGHINFPICATSTFKINEG
jgi:hypothetical protein